MSDSEHIEGPWIVQGEGYDAAVYEADGGLVASVTGSYRTRPDRARLIAAAPKLKEALEYVKGILSFHEGSEAPEHAGAEPTMRLNGEDLLELLSTVRKALESAGESL